MSCLLGAAREDEDMGAGSSGQPPEPTDAERLAQAHELYHQERLRADHLEQEVEKLRKGKQPGRDPLRHTGLRTDRFSLPRPENYKGPPDTGPTGVYPIDHPPSMSGVKPIFMEKPEHFKGAHNDIERFIGDCKTYFKVFQYHYMQHPALMVVFATSLMRGAAQDWWVHLRDEYKYTPTNNEDDDEDDPPFDSGPRYRFPDWNKFISMVREQFRDPAIELVHEKKMGELRMMGPAYLFFRQMEREAKLANRLDDQSDRGVLVEVVWKGIPHDYSRIIANIGFGIPRNYQEWKTRIITMYEECTKDGVYAQTHFEPRRDDRRPHQGQKPNTATSSRPAAGGVTSSLPAKQNDRPRNDRWKWYTPKGADAQMQIDAQRSKLMSEGRCFRCQKKGHLSKDCPEKTTGH